jgi:glycosidase
MSGVYHPSLYQINTRCLLRDVGRGATLDDVPDALLDEVAGWGFDWVWFLGVWQTGPVGRQVSRSNPEWLREYAKDLPDLREEDISGSPFAIRAYTTHEDFGGDAALARLRKRLRQFGLKLLLDFVPNHTAPDHPWVAAHPEYYVQGTAEDLAREPHNYWRAPDGRIFAHGRDPYFPGWPDVLQLNYRHPAFRAAMIEELRHISDRCDGVRCDMAMLVLPDIFNRTWHSRSLPTDGARPVDDSFWPDATAAVRARMPGFLFMAEVYWDLEWVMQQQGFDYTYDKRLYDRLREGHAGPVRGHLRADPEFSRRLVRFLENHDEGRAASAFRPECHPAAAVITYLIPGLRFFHEGQFEGRRVRVPMHLGRRPSEPVNEALRAFYLHLLEVLRRPEVRTGQWRLHDCRPAWDGNTSWEQFFVFTWEGEASQRLLVAVNYGAVHGQCYAALPLAAWDGKTVRLRDLFGTAEHERHDLPRNGLYLDLPPWGYHVFEALV